MSPFLIILHCSFFILNCPPALQQEKKELTPAEVLEHVKQTYESMADAKAQFRQTVTFKYARIEQSFSGTLMMKRGNKYRIESQQQTLVTDGRTVWMYSTANNQVLIDSYKSTARTFSPDRFLFNLPGNFSPTFLNENASSVGASFVLKLVPKSSDTFAKILKVWVADRDWTVRKIEYVDMNDTKTVYILSNVVINNGISDSLFVYSAPRGAEVVDLRTAQSPR